MPRPKRKNLLALPSNIVEGGFPSPENIPQNIANYGYSCPRQQFIESFEEVSLVRLAEIWQVSVRSLGQWAREQNWKAQRRRYWQRCEEQLGELSMEQIAQTRAKEILARYDGWNQLRANLMATAQRGGADRITPSGAVRFVPYGPDDWDGVAKGLERIEKNIDNTIGLVRLTQGSQVEEEANGPVTRRRLTINVVEEVSSNQLPEATAPAFEVFPSSPDQRIPQMKEAEVLSSKNPESK